ncbi:MAG TPA: hypothetical protein VFT43_04440 [Candidatus Polarisedimenticolia bacterium]|nr:hypothetical protein [Candidatus Polarisedimenticolia bacterium]
MTGINKRRVWIGALAAGVVWNIWSIVVNTVFLRPHYAVAQEAGLLLKAPRYGSFLPIWIISLFVAAYVMTMLYASARATCGAGPKTALGIGLMVGFIAAFPGNFATATWSPMSRMLPLWWMLDIWVGAILAALVAGFLYRDQG